MATKSRLVLNAALTISDEGLHVDFDGTSPASSHGINVVYNYCLAYTAFGVKCLVAPDVPNNAGSLAPITVSAPEGCVLNVNRPWPVAARHTVGHMLPDAVFGCLHQAMAGGVPAEGASLVVEPADLRWRLIGRRDRHGCRCKCTAGIQHRDFPLRRRRCATGQRWAERDGISFRRAHDTRGSNRRAWRLLCSIAASSAKAPAAPEDFAAGSARSLSSAAPTMLQSHCFAISNGCTIPREDAKAVRLAQTGQYHFVQSKPIRPKGAQTVPARDAICLALPGGGGFGDPRTRDPQRVLDDVLDGLITVR